MLIIFVRGFILYFLVVVVMRVMGKRQIAQMQPFELVIMIMIADLAATPMEDSAIPLVNGFIPILTLFTVQILISFLSLKSEGFRKLICGKPSVIIHKGKIDQGELSKLRININDLMEQLRSKDFHNINEVEFAILETNGDLNVIPKSDHRPVVLKDLNILSIKEELPITLIIDGKLNIENLSKSGHNQQWLKEKLKENNIQSIEDVFFAFLSSEREFYVQQKDL